MTEHLPIQRWQHLPECWAKHQSDPQAWCICHELRACEQRVEESIDRAWEQAAQLAVAHARTATLDAAREAVAALDAYYAEGVLCHCEIKRVITAINALKEKQ